MNIKPGYLTKNFSKAEILCKCGKCTPIYDYDFLNRLQGLRNEFDRSMIINSGYRCEEYNRQIGGALVSMHTKGIAVDVSTNNWPSEAIYRFVKLALNFEFKGIGVAKDYIHIDLRTSNEAIWTY